MSGLELLDRGERAQLFWLIEGAAAGLETADEVVDCLWTWARTGAEGADLLAVVGHDVAHALARAILSTHGLDCPPVEDAAAEFRRRREVETFEEEAARIVREQAERRAKVRAQTRRLVSAAVVPRRLRAIFGTDPDARERLALTLQAKRSGLYWRSVPCPACGRPSVWFAVSEGGAHCGHANTCGWSASVYDLAVLSGLETM